MGSNTSVDGSTIELIVQNKEIHTIQKDLLTSSQQKNKVKFNFVGGPPWEDLQRTVVFRVEKELYNVSLGTDGIVNIPWEICQDQYLGKIIYVGVRGIDSEGTLVYPTPFFRLGVLEKGAGMIGTQEPSDPTMTPYDTAVSLARQWAIGPTETTESPSVTNNSKYWAEKAAQSAQTAETTVDNIETAVSDAKQSANNAAASAAEAKTSAKSAQDAVTQAQSARDQYPKIGSNGHWEYYVPERGRYVDSGVLAQFTIRKVYATVSEMMADYGGSDTSIGDFVMISGDVEEPDTGKLYVKVADSTTKFSFIADLSGAQGVQGPQGEQGIQGPQGNSAYMFEAYYLGEGLVGTVDTITPENIMEKVADQIPVCALLAWAPDGNEENAVAYQFPLTYVKSDLSEACFRGQVHNDAWYTLTLTLDSNGTVTSKLEEVGVAVASGDEVAY